MEHIEAASGASGRTGDAATTGKSGTENAATAGDRGTDGDGASFVIDHLIDALGEVMPAAEKAKLAPYGERAAKAGSAPAAERRRGLRCAEWAVDLVGMPAHSHLGKLAVKAREVVRELGRTASTEMADAQLLVYWKDRSAISPGTAAEITWVAEAVHAAAAVAKAVGWDKVPWQGLLGDLLAIRSH